MQGICVSASLSPDGWLGSDCGEVDPSGFSRFANIISPNSSIGNANGKNISFVSPLFSDLESLTKFSYFE